MNRLTVLTDISGRVALDTRGSARVTAAAVAISTSECLALRTELQKQMPKWSDCTLDDAERIVECLATRALAIGVISVNKDTPAWRQFAEDAKVLQHAIVAQSRRPAGWVRPTNLLAFQMLAGACAIAKGHAIRVGPTRRIVDAQGHELIDCAIVCDSDISGEENLEVFKSFWGKLDGPRSRLSQLGINISHREVLVLTEQEEPLLLLADYAAGITHAALLKVPGRIRLPLSPSQANGLLSALRKTGKVVVETIDFDVSYDEIFGPVMAHAREQAAC